MRIAVNRHGRASVSAAGAIGRDDESSGAKEEVPLA